MIVGPILPAPEPTPVGPWGTKPTPLVPRAYRQRYGGRRAARDLRSAAGRPDLMLYDLDAGFWNEAPWTAVPPKAFKSLRWQLATLPVLHDVDVLAAGTPVEQLLALPFRTRTHNVANRLGPKEEHDGRLSRTLTATDVLAYRNAGVMVVLDLLAVVEGTWADPATSGPVSANGDPLNPDAQPWGDTEAEPDDGQAQPGSDVPLATTRNGAARMPESLADLLSAAAEFRDASTLGEALQTDLGALAEKTGLAKELDSVELDSLGLVDRGRHTAGLLREIEDIKARFTPKEALLVRRRLYRRRPETLESLGKALDVTRERVRQIEKKLKRKIADRAGRRVAIVAGAGAHRIAPIARAEEVDRQLRSLFDDPEDEAVPLACRMIRARLGYRARKDARKDLELNGQAAEAVQELCRFAREHQDDAGLLDENALRSRLPDQSWTTHWDLLVDACGFHRIDSLLGLRNTLKARVKAAVLNIGRVASREELAEHCGLPRQRTVSYLSALPSVARADKTRWGLTEWIDDVYEGVANEILQRIDEDGGATRVERVLEELPRLFGASETTVRAYLGAPQFQVRNGWVRRANPSAIRLRSLDDAVDGRDQQGRPWWGFQVKKQHFRGHSVLGLPPEIAGELGCPPNGRIEVMLTEPPDCRPLSVSWKLTSLNGPSLGYVSRPLDRLGVKSGDHMRLILCDDGTVELRQTDAQTSPDHSDPGPNTAEAIIERLKQRRQVL